MKMLDRALIDVGQNRVSAAKGQQGRLGENQPICVSAAFQPYSAHGQPMTAAHKAKPTTMTLHKPGQENKAWDGVGVSSSINAGP
ncbi:hypothetical protein [Methylomonas subterranea]|uniref:hypothetical protein n=1 Tax=Methylomonas subterranea TaxID=2952225 RepID=UPI003FD48F55